MIQALNYFSQKKNITKGVPTVFNNYHLELNKLYIITINGRKTVSGIVRLIQTTPRAYNFLDIKTGKCILSVGLPDARFSKTETNSDYVLIRLAERQFSITSCEQPAEEIVQFKTTLKKGFLRILWLESSNDPDELEIT